MHFYLLLRPFVSYLIINAFITSTSSQYVPRVRPELQSPVIRPVGASVHMPCPVHEDKNGMTFFEWSRDKGEQIDSYSPSRVRFTDKGILKIRSAVVADSGVYTCKAINGFGFTTASVVLKIVPSEDFSKLNPNPTLDNSYPGLYPREDIKYPTLDSNSNIDVEYKPTEKVMPKPIVYEKAVGSFLVLDCANNIRGLWYKNGKRLYQKKRKSMTLTLRPEDTGSYECIGNNGLEQLNTTFVIRVFDNPKPELKEFNPINSTVFLGDKAVFHCKVYSLVKPNIQWLKSINGVHDKNEAIHMGLIPRDTFPGLHLTEKYYKVIKSGKVVDDGEGNYFNNLIIDKTTYNDSGNYACVVATTSHGEVDILHKSTYLTVVGPNSHTNTDHYGPGSQFVPVSNTLSSVLITSLVVVFVFATIAAIACCIKRTNNRNEIYRENNNRIDRSLALKGHSSDSDQTSVSQRQYYFPESVHTSNYSYGLEAMHWNTECSDYTSSERSPYQT